MTAALLAALAAALAVAPRPRPPPASRAAPEPAEEGIVRRFRVAWTVLAAVGALAFLDGPLRLPLAAAAAVGVWVVVSRAEPADTRRRRARVAADLPHVVTLLGCALRSGAAPAEGLGVVARALPGPAADLITPVAARLSLGGDPVDVWSDLTTVPGLAPLGRTLGRAHRTGASVVDAVERLADELTGAARAAVEDKARAVGVKAAVPLGLCLLPAFVLLGIVPLVAGLVGGLTG